MCWSLEASAALAVAGGLTTGYAILKKKPKSLWLPLAYFTGMEALQAVQYIVVDLCGLPANQILTLVGYVHIAFQPFFINMVAMYFIPPHIKEKISRYVYFFCALAAVSMLIQLYPQASLGQCLPGSMLCGETLCTVSGSWHIAWDVPLNGIYNGLYDLFQVSMPGYVLVGLILPFLYGSWRLNLYQMTFGLFLALLLTSNPNEAAAIWCLLSIGIVILIVGDKPVAKHLHVRSWWLWKYLK
jgi:Family of unknown function (DUF5765)